MGSSIGLSFIKKFIPTFDEAIIIISEDLKSVINFNLRTDILSTQVFSRMQVIFEASNLSMYKANMNYWKYFALLIIFHAIIEIISLHQGKGYF